MKITMKLTSKTFALTLFAALAVVTSAQAAKKSDAAAPAGKAPDKFTVTFKTTKGNIDLDCTRDWAPKGADRLYELVKGGFFKDIAFFRVIDGFMAQFGIHGDPKTAAKWRENRITDDPVKGSNTAGMLSFATAGPDTRTTQMFINLVDNTRLDASGFSPICKTTDKGMAIVKKLHSGYGEGAPSGHGPDQGEIETKGNKYLKKDFPKLDYIKSASAK